MSDMVIHAGTIGNLTDAEFVTGTPEEMAAAKARRAAQIAILAARKRSEWREFSLDSLTFEGKYVLVEEDDLVLEALKVPIWPGGDHRFAFNEHLVYGFFVNEAGGLVFLGQPEHGGPRSITMLRVKQKQREHVRKMAELDRKTALITTPILPVTLAELEGRDLPTLKAAADIVNESGKLEVVGDRLRVHLRVRADRELDAARVLYGAEQMVVDAIKSAERGKGKEIALPDVQVLAGGGVA